MARYTFRRIADGPRSVRSAFRRSRRYELHHQDGTATVVTLHELDSALDARAHPADFWACVSAADAVFAGGDAAAIEWPTGKVVDPRVEHVFTAEDRVAQLCDLESLCSRLADAFAKHGDVRAADSFRARAATATRLLAEGWTQPDLNELGVTFPDGAWWLNPKALDHDAPREPWQDEVALLHGHAKATASDLRAVATLYRA